MPTTLAFDVYGTLIDTHGVVEKLETFIDDQARAFSQAWREKQLEYSFRRGLMRRYVNFAACTQQSLDYTCQRLNVELSDEDKAELLAIYKVLPAFDDVDSALTTLRENNIQCYAFSNGTAEAVKGLLQHAKIDHHFTDVVSVDDLQTFKPNPDVYDYFVQRADSEKPDTWLISSNPFDVTGAISSGLNAAWIQRTAENIFDPWEFEPTVIVNNLNMLTDHLTGHS